ncbi:penicillin-binding protein 2 [Thermocrinis albus]|uniref:penicillin-binding protein 2 n=1 Tax=Thermocrinis albus TaxID=136094 RepID=UPI0011D087C9|nr:penicillin-binding protein 2 [Thermocrinis albus]
MRRRTFLFAMLSIILYITILGRLLYLQLIKGTYYRELSHRNYVRSRIVYARRGDILDRNGVKLAYDLPQYVMFIDPQVLDERDTLRELVRNLKEIFQLDIEEENLLKRRGGAQPIYIKKLTPEELNSFYNNSFRLPGVFVNTVPQRYYPFGEMAAHLLGYVGYPSEEEMKRYADRIGPQSLVGKSGLERSMESILLGYVGREDVMVNAVGKVLGKIRDVEPVPGNTLVLTIDSRIQEIAYNTFKESGHKAGAVLVLNARTGEVLALVSMPSYDPNLVSEKWEDYAKDPLKPMFNRALMAAYPPASVIKVAYACGLLEEGLSLREGVLCKGKFHLGDRDFYCWNRHGHGWENVVRAVRDSCDVFFYHHGYYTLGPNKMERILRDFSLGERVPFELPNATGFIPSPQWKKRKMGEPWYGGDTINMSIGQGFMRATLLQQCLMVMAVANDGVIYKPTLLKEVRDVNGRVLWSNKRTVYKVVKMRPEVFAVVREAMREVVRSGTAVSANSSIAEIAGKTGTAQVSPYTRGRKNVPYHLRDHAWFVGFAPYRDPLFIVGVLVEHGASGGSAAAPIARRIVEGIYIAGIHKELQ